MSTVTETLNALIRDIPPLRDAACRDRTEVFDVRDGRDHKAIQQAQAICRECPVLQRCTEWLDGLPKFRRPSGVVAGRFVPPPRLRPLTEKKPQPPTKCDRAVDWLANYLADGPVLSTALRADAVRAGIELHNLARARRYLGVELERLKQHGGQRMWSLPYTTNRKRSTMHTAVDDDMSRAKRAGDSRRTIEATLFYHDGEMEAVGQVLHEATSCGRGHHFTFALIENLLAVLCLKGNPERVEQMRGEIARLIAVETGDNTGEDNKDD